MFPVLRFSLWLAAAAALFPILAQADPPARVGRLSLLEGSVSLRTDREDAGSAASTNWPVSGGAILETGRDGRAEVRIGSTAFRLASDTGVEFAAIDDQRIALQVARGALAVSLHAREPADELEVATPAAGIRFAGPGHYRIDVDAATGDTQVSSRDGSARVYRNGAELAVPAGARAVVAAGGGWHLSGLYRDAFDAWSDARDAGSTAREARRYVSPEMTGYEDLDRYGEWDSVPEYGTVWYPSAVPAGWAPYRHGRWAWVPPWGWTWIDEAPWGFAPFHYGRWLFVAGRWAWVPGAYAARPVYAPALVAWVGQPGWSVGFSFGTAPAVGWFPLAPREVFVPGYRCSPAYVRQVNVTQVTNVTVIERAVAAPAATRPQLAYRSLSQAVTVVPAEAMRSGRPVAGRHQPDRRALTQAPVSVRAPEGKWLAPAAAAFRPQPEEPPHRQARPSARKDFTPDSRFVAPATTAAPASPVVPRQGEFDSRSRRHEERFPAPAGGPPAAPPAVAAPALRMEGGARPAVPPGFREMPSAGPAPLPREAARSPAPATAPAANPLSPRPESAVRPAIPAREAVQPPAAVGREASRRQVPEAGAPMVPRPAEPATRRDGDEWRGRRASPGERVQEVPAIEREEAMRRHPPGWQGERRSPRGEAPAERTAAPPSPPSPPSPPLRQASPPAPPVQAREPVSRPAPMEMRRPAEAMPRPEAPHPPARVEAPRPAPSEGRPAEARREGGERRRDHGPGRDPQ